MKKILFFFLSLIISSVSVNAQIASKMKGYMKDNPTDEKAISIYLELRESTKKLDAYICEVSGVNTKELNNRSQEERTKIRNTRKELLNSKDEKLLDLRSKIQDNKETISDYLKSVDYVAPSKYDRAAQKGNRNRKQ